MVKKLRKDSIMLKNNWTGNLESLEQMIKKKNNIVTKCKSKDKIKLDLKHSLFVNEKARACVFAVHLI